MDPRLPHRLAIPVLAAAALLVTPAAAWSPSLTALLEVTPSDSLVRPLKRYETFHRHASEAGEAALLLGQLHYARGEYRQAADAFMRAAARFDPRRKAEARYWAGLAWIGTGDPSQARAVLEEAARPGSPVRSEALFALATLWERARRPERAQEALTVLLTEAPGSMSAAALERVAELGTRLGRPADGERARERLRREFPRSIEALRVGRVPTEEAGAEPPAAVAPAPTRSPAASPAQVYALQIGAFLELDRARALADAARRAGWQPVQVTSLGDPSANLYVVRVGRYAAPEAAREAGSRAARLLDVPWRVVTVP